MNSGVAIVAERSDDLDVGARSEGLLVAAAESTLAIVAIVPIVSSSIVPPEHAMLAPQILRQNELDLVIFWLDNVGEFVATAVSELELVCVEALLGFQLVFWLQRAEREFEMTQMARWQIDDHFDYRVGLVTANEMFG